MILNTAISHFNQDIERSRQLLSHARALTDGAVKSDVFRASWMMAVGALDAYFCDAYGDLVARTLRAKKAQPTIPLPNSLLNIDIPIQVVLDRDLNSGWLWRMLARDLIEKDNVLSIKKIKSLFNRFFRTNGKLFDATGLVLERWIMLEQNHHRLFGFNRTEYRKGNQQKKRQLREKAVKHIEERFSSIFQRRHDCIHNCDRPKIAINRAQITHSYIEKVIEDINFIVQRCNEDFRSEFSYFIIQL